MNPRAGTYNLPRKMKSRGIELTTSKNQSRVCWHGRTWSAGSAHRVSFGSSSSSSPTRRSGIWKPSTVQSSVDICAASSVDGGNNLSVSLMMAGMYTNFCRSES